MLEWVWIVPVGIGRENWRLSAGCYRNYQKKWFESKLSKVQPRVIWVYLKWARSTNRGPKRLKTRAFFSSIPNGSNCWMSQVCFCLQINPMKLFIWDECCHLAVLIPHRPAMPLACSPYVFVAVKSIICLYNFFCLCLFCPHSFLLYPCILSLLCLKVYS